MNDCNGKSMAKLYGHISQTSEAIGIKQNNWLDGYLKFGYNRLYNFKCLMKMLTADG